MTTGAPRPILAAVAVVTGRRIRASLASNIAPAETHQWPSASIA